MDLCSTLPSSPFHFQLFPMLSSDSPGTLSFSLPKSPSFLVTLQALSLSLFLAKVTKPLTQQNHKSYMQRNCNLLSHAAQSLSPIFHAYHYCQEPYRLHLPNLSYISGSQVFQPCNDLWYLPKIRSRISQACLCISASNSLRWSRNIAMMSRWFALRRTSSSNGKSHSKRTIRACTSLKTLVTLSKPIIQPISWSSTASCNGRVLVRLSILSTDGIAILFLSLNASVPLTIQWFLNFYFQRLLGQLSESSMSKHLTCVSRTRSQPQPVEIFSMLISRQVVGVFTVQTPHLCLQDLLPTSACRDTPSISKTCHLRQSIDKSPSTNDLTANMPQK